MQAAIVRFAVFWRRTGTRQDLAKYLCRTFANEYEVELERQRLLETTTDVVTSTRLPPAQQLPTEGTTVFDTGEADMQGRKLPQPLPKPADDEDEEPTDVHVESSETAQARDSTRLLERTDDVGGPWSQGTEPLLPPLRGSVPEADDSRGASAAGSTMRKDGATDPSAESAKLSAPEPVRRYVPRVDTSVDEDVLVPAPAPRRVTGERLDSSRVPAEAENSATEWAEAPPDPPVERSRTVSGSTAKVRPIPLALEAPDQRAEAGPDAGHDASTLALSSSPRGAHQKAPSGAVLALAVVAGTMVGAAGLWGLTRTPVLGRGTLVIRTGFEKAKVAVDEKLQTRGTTAVVALPVGTHKVTMEVEGFLPDIQEAVVRPGEITEVRFVERSRRGQLRIETIPAGAQVFIDGKPRSGQTPMTVDDLEPGIPHELQLRHPDADTDSSKVQTEAGQTFRVDKTLRMRVSRVAVAPVPADAAVLWDGTFKGTGRTVVKGIRMGQRGTLKVARAGCESQDDEVTPKGEVEIEKPVVLKCKGMDAVVTLDGPGGGRLRIDGVETGLLVPFSGYRLPSGKHAFELTHDRRSRSWTATVLPGNHVLSMGE
jgi:hypothetical protein